MNITRRAALRGAAAVTADKPVSNVIELPAPTSGLAEARRLLERERDDIYLVKMRALFDRLTEIDRILGDTEKPTKKSLKEAP